MRLQVSLRVPLIVSQSERHSTDVSGLTAAALLLLPCPSSQLKREKDSLCAPSWQTRSISRKQTVNHLATAEQQAAERESR